MCQSSWNWWLCRPFLTRPGANNVEGIRRNTRDNQTKFRTQVMDFPQPQSYHQNATTALATSDIILTTMQLSMRWSEHYTYRNNVRAAAAAAVAASDLCCLISGTDRWLFKSFSGQLVYLLCSHRWRLCNQLLGEAAGATTFDFSIWHYMTICQE